MPQIKPKRHNLLGFLTNRKNKEKEIQTPCILKCVYFTLQKTKTKTKNSKSKEKGRRRRRSTVEGGESEGRVYSDGGKTQRKNWGGCEGKWFSLRGNGNVSRKIAICY